MERAYSLAKKDGFASSSSVSIYVLGQQNAGKTCLIASLLGDNFEEQIGTRGADVDVCKIYASKWSRLKKKDVPKELQRRYLGKLKVTAEIIKMSDHDEQQHYSSEPPSKKQYLGNTHLLSKVVESDLDEVKCAEGLIDDDAVNAIIWDFAGQSVYHGLHSVFLKEDNVTMIVFDASQQLQDPTKDRDSHKDPYTQKSISPSTTGYESVCYWLQSIHSIRKDGKMLGATSLFVPTVLLVATHIDLIGDSEAIEKRKKEIIDELFLALRCQQFAKHIAGVENKLRKALEDNCFFISNKVRNIKELDRLREKLIKASWYIMNTQHPIVYLNIEKKLLSLDKTAITSKKFHDIALDCGFTAKLNSKEFRGALAYFHSKGTILHHPKFESLKKVIVLSPDWLTKLFSYIIIAHPYEVESDHTLEFDRLIKRGILQEEFIAFMVNKFNEEQNKFSVSIKTQQAIEFAQHFGFIAEVSSSTYFLEEVDQLPECKNRVFIVPPMLPMNLPDDVKVQDKHTEARIVYFKFPDGFIPLMVYYHMLTACIKRNVERKENLYW